MADLEAALPTLTANVTQSQAAIAAQKLVLDHLKGELAAANSALSAAQAAAAAKASEVAGLQSQLPA